MQIRKNWSYFFFTVLSAVGIFYLFAHGLTTLEAGDAYMRLAQAGLLLLLFVVWGLFSLTARVSFRLRLDEKLSGKKKWVRWTEALFVVLILLLAVLVRLSVIQNAPETYQQEYKDYYEIALSLQDNSIQDYGGGYGGTVAARPTLMGYSFALLLVFRIFGAEVRAGQYMNVVCAVGGVFFAYRIARKTGGRMAGVVALLISAFLPSAVTAVAILSPQCLLAFFALLCIWLFVSLVKDYDGQTTKGLKAILLHVLLGALLGMMAAVSALAAVLVIAFVIFLLPGKMKLPAEPLNDIPLTVRALKWGWLRCIMILIPYFIVAGVITSNIEMTVDRDISVGTVALGGELWTGVAPASGRAGAADTAEVLVENYLTLADSGERVIGQYASLLEEGTSARDWSDAVSQASRVDGVLFLGVMFYALIGLVFLLSRGGNPAFVLALVYVGSVAAYLAGSEQGAFLSCQMVSLLSEMAVGLIFARQRQASRDRMDEHETHEQEAALERYRQQMEKQEEERLTKLRKEVYTNAFDLDKALREGHVTVSVSEAYVRGAAPAQADRTAAAQKRSW